MCGYVLGNFGGKLDNFLFHHLVTLQMTELFLSLCRDPSTVLSSKQYSGFGAEVVVQLAERSLPKPEDPGSNPVISNCY